MDSATPSHFRRRLIVSLIVIAVAFGVGHAALAKLKSLTNLRAVRDPESSSGWTIEVGPFPGWETVPTW